MGLLLECDRFGVFNFCLLGEMVYRYQLSDRFRDGSAFLRMHPIHGPIRCGRYMPCGVSPWACEWDARRVVK